MAEAPVAPPVAPPQHVPVTPTSVGSATPSSKGEIKAVPQPITPTAPPKPGSAKERLFADLQKKAKTPEQIEARTSTPPVEKSGTEQAQEGTEQTPTESGEAPPAEGTAPKAGEKPAKVNPWKLVDEYKGKVAALEKQVVEARSSVLPEQDRKSFEERVSKAETRAKELEDHIRFVDYSKSQEFETKYKQPYERSWARAMNELKEITVNTESGEARAVTPDDLLLLVNSPLGKAREMANAMFGDFADDVMAHRKEIRSLYEAQNTALEEARKTGADRTKKEQEDFQRQQGEINKHVTETWQQANDAATKDEKYGKFFTPIEGDEDGNQRLGKGFELVDRAFGENPMDPKLTPEERANVVKRHAAVRNRAAAFGRLVLQNNKQAERIAQLEKELSEFQESTPGTGGGRVSVANGTVTISAKEQMAAALRKIAK